MVRVGALGQLEVKVIFRGKKIFLFIFLIFLIFLTFLIFLRLTTLVLGIISMDVITFPFPWIRRVAFSSVPSLWTIVKSTATLKIPSRTFSALKVMSASTVITSEILSTMFSSRLPMIGFKKWGLHLKQLPNRKCSFLKNIDDWS